MRIRVALVLLLVLSYARSSITIGHAQRGSSAPSIDAFVTVERSVPVFEVVYRFGRSDPALSGAYGPNITAPRSAWYLEYQRAGAYDVIAGVLRHDVGLIAVGLRTLHFGLARQAEDGSFPGSIWPFHGTAMFLSEAAPALIVLRTSRYGRRFAKELQWEAQSMQRAAHYMVDAVGGPGRIDDWTKNHRYYEAALALGAVGVLTGDSTLVHWSTIYAWHAIGMERPGGVMPENGGHDSGYQALGMVSASRYLRLLASGPLYHSLYKVLQRGEAWELSRIGPDGSVNQTGDTRSAACREHDPVGRCKTVMYAPIFSSLARWAEIRVDQRFADASKLVWLRSGYAGQGPHLARA